VAISLGVLGVEDADQVQPGLRHTWLALRQLRGGH
jgi:hypothetical protein